MTQIVGMKVRKGGTGIKNVLGNTIMPVYKTKTTLSRRQPAKKIISHQHKRQKQCPREELLPLCAAGFSGEHNEFRTTATWKQIERCLSSVEKNRKGAVKIIRNNQYPESFLV